MRHETHEVAVSGAQKISRLCFVCGQANELGLHAQFLSLADGRLCAEFVAREEHQSYPGRVHGGVISAVLDEAIGRVIQIEQPDEFAVTIELSVKYRKPVPIGVPLRVIAWRTKESPRVFEGEGQLLLPDGTVAAQGFARYFRQRVDAIAEGGFADDDWFVDKREVPTQLVV